VVKASHRLFCIFRQAGARLIMVKGGIECKR